MNQKHIVSDVPRHGFCDPLIQKLEPLSTDSRSEFAHHFTVRFVCFGTARTTRLFKIGFCVFPKPPSSLYEFTFFCYENLFDWACNARVAPSIAVSCLLCIHRCPSFPSIASLIRFVALKTRIDGRARRPSTPFDAEQQGALRRALWACEAPARCCVS
eukprot:Selendium_serpulae@DN2375_c1_g1_i2.p1